MKIFTIGFTRKSAEEFFGLLKQPDLKRVVDVRLNNKSQLSGFAKQDDLRFFLRELLEVDYAHEPVLAPTQEMLDGYRKQQGSWDQYASDFCALIEERQIEKVIDRKLLAGACLLCSEPTPHQCHRRLVAEYLREKWNVVEIQHL